MLITWQSTLFLTTFFLQFGARRSKRLRTFSTKLDGRYHYDKKTKLLVGAKLPIINEANDVSDLEERFQNSLQKLKGQRLDVMYGCAVEYPNWQTYLHYVDFFSAQSVLGERLRCLTRIFLILLSGKNILSPRLYLDFKYHFVVLLIP